MSVPKHTFGLDRKDYRDRGYPVEGEIMGLYLLPEKVPVDDMMMILKFSVR
jgi:hypothetical protein